ncbi:MAG: hypothetical protein AAF902_05775 [Chloroflexota bacterium]
MDLETKRQFVFDVAEKLGWQAFNDSKNERFVYCANGDLMFMVRLDYYALPKKDQVCISGCWPKSKVPSDSGYRYYPRNSKSIHCSANKKVDVAARDIQKRFINWFVDKYAEMKAKRDNRYAEWSSEERDLGLVAEAVEATRIIRGGSLRPTWVSATSMVQKGEMGVVRNYNGKWTVAVDGLSILEAVEIGEFINSVINRRATENE